MPEPITPPDNSRDIMFTIIDDDSVECGGQTLRGWCGIDDKETYTEPDTFWFFCPDNEAYWDQDQIVSWTEISKITS